MGILASTIYCIGGRDYIFENYQRYQLVSREWRRASPGTVRWIANQPFHLYRTSVYRNPGFWCRLDHYWSIFDPTKENIEALKRVLDHGQ
jgi:hypothetical protein